LPTTSISDDEKALTTVFVTYHVLLKLGFTQERIIQSLTATSSGLEEALEWVRLTVNKLIVVVAQFERRRMYKSRRLCPTGWYGHTEILLMTELSLCEADAPLVDSMPELEEAKADVEPSKPKPVDQDSPRGPLFQSLDASDSEPEDELNLNKENEKWASLMMQLDNLRITSGKKSKKGKSNGVVLETPELRRLKDKLATVEKEYMFSRKDAGKSSPGRADLRHSSKIPSSEKRCPGSGRSIAGQSGRFRRGGGSRILACPR
jgi:ATP-dependent RNA helicase DHX29